MLKQSLKLGVKAGRPILLLIIFEVLLMFIYGMYTQVSGTSGAFGVEVFDGSLFNTVFYVVLFVFQLVWMLAMIRVFVKPDDNTIAHIFGKSMWVKLPAIGYSDCCKFCFCDSRIIVGSMVIYVYVCFSY